MSAFPPQRSVASIPVSQHIALKYLSAYLEAAKSCPHLLPNARLEPSGPTAGSSTSNVTIHNLQRVEAGLRGEWLAPTLDLGEGNVVIAKGMDDGTNKLPEDADDWMDLDQYQRQQSIEVGDGGEGAAGVVADLELYSDLEKPVNKKARKAEKAKRRKEERKTRNMKDIQLAD